MRIFIPYKLLILGIFFAVVLPVEAESLKEGVQEHLPGKAFPKPLADSKATLPVMQNPFEIPKGAEEVILQVKSLVIENLDPALEQEIYVMRESFLKRPEQTLEAVYLFSHAITRLYNRRGFIFTRCLVVPQEIDKTKAIIRLRIVTSSLGTITVNQEGQRVPIIMAYVNRMYQQGKMDTKVLEKYLFLMNDLPGYTVRSYFTADDETPDLFYLHLEVTKNANLHTLRVSNKSSPYKKLKISATTMLVDTIFQSNESVILALEKGIYGEDTRSLKWNLAVQYPLSVRGDEVHFLFSYGDNLSGSSGNYPIQSTSTNIEGQYKKVFLRGSRFNIRGLLGLGHKILSSELVPRADVLSGADIQSNVNIYKDRYPYFYLEGSIDWATPSSVSLFSMKYVSSLKSEGIFGESRAESTQDATPTFRYLVLSTSRTQSILNLGLSFELQSYFLLSSDPLPSLEGVSYGYGEYGGIFPSSIIGDEGYTARVEVSLTLPKYGFIPYAFFDMGKMTKKTRLHAQESSYYMVDTLAKRSSYGLGLRLQLHRMVGDFVFTFPTKKYEAKAGGRKYLFFFTLTSFF